MINKAGLLILHNLQNFFLKNDTTHKELRRAATRFPAGWSLGDGNSAMAFIFSAFGFEPFPGIR
jgi:hypothetical protein